MSRVVGNRCRAWQSASPCWPITRAPPASSSATPIAIATSREWSSPRLVSSATFRRPSFCYWFPRSSTSCTTIRSPQLQKGALPASLKRLQAALTSPRPTSRAISTARRSEQGPCHQQQHGIMCGVLCRSEPACLRHRLPHLKARTGLLEPSVARWGVDDGEEVIAAPTDPACRGTQCMNER